MLAIAKHAGQGVLEIVRVQREKHAREAIPHTQCDEFETHTGTLCIRTLHPTLDSVHVLQYLLDFRSPSSGRRPFGGDEGLHAEWVQAGRPALPRTAPPYAGPCWARTVRGALVMVMATAMAVGMGVATGVGMGRRRACGHGVCVVSSRASHLRQL